MVTSLNADVNAQYERKFSPSKALTSATIGAAGFKVASDLSLRYQAKKVLNNYANSHILVSDQFVTEATQNAKSICEEASKTLAKTNYLTKIKGYIKSPLTAVSNAKEYLTNNIKGINKNDITSKIKNVADKSMSTAKSLKGETVKETLKNVLEATKTAKGQKALILAAGAISGILLFGSSKVVKKRPENQA